MRMKNFYTTICKLKVKNKPVEYANLSRFLVQKDLNGDIEADYIATRHFILIISEFNQSEYLKSFGFGKRSFVEYIAKKQ